MKYFLPNATLPPGLTLESLHKAMAQTADVVSHLNNALSEKDMGPLSSIIQRNNFSGIVSNIFTKALDTHSPFKDNSDQEYPDLLSETDGLEVKCTFSASKGAESHNAHSGWHVIGSFDLVDSALVWTCMKFANLVAYDLPDSDWNYCGSKRNENGSQRTETYTTNTVGRGKLLSGICYLDTDMVPNWHRWRGLTPHIRQSILNV
jgi:hypothetical protein